MNNVANIMQDQGQLLEKVITCNDLSGLSSMEKVQHIKNVCKTLNLNPLTKPIQLLKFQGKEIAYFTKDATEQLRKTNKVSITKIDTKIMEGIYVVTAYASTPDGRQDSSTGAISIGGLKGDQLCNALLKAETKAKRRVTLSICGLGYIDESEAESIPNSTKVDVYNLDKNNDTKFIKEEIKGESFDNDVAELKILIDSLGVSEEIVKKWLEKANAKNFEEMSHSAITACIDYLRSKL